MWHRFPAVCVRICREGQHFRGYVRLPITVFILSVTDRGVQTLNNYFDYGIPFKHISTTKSYCPRLFTTLERRHTWRSPGVCCLGTSFRYDPISRNLYHTKPEYLLIVRDVTFFSARLPAGFLINAFHDEACVKHSRRNVNTKYWMSHMATLLCTSLVLKPSL